MIYCNKCKGPLQPGEEAVAIDNIMIEADGSYETPKDDPAYYHSTCAPSHASIEVRIQSMSCEEIIRDAFLPALNRIIGMYHDRGFEEDEPNVYTTEAEKWEEVRILVMGIILQNKVSL